MGTHYVPGAVQASFTYHLPDSSPQPRTQVYCCSILQGGKLRLREVKQLAIGHATESGEAQLQTQGTDCLTQLVPSFPGFWRDGGAIY